MMNISVPIDKSFCVPIDKNFRVASIPISREHLFNMCCYVLMYL